MSEWWSYRPSDFLLFAPRTYYRLVELHNTELWPLQAVALVLALVLLALAWRGGRRAGIVVGSALAVAWGFVGWRFHWHHYATINWAAVYFAAAFAVQAALLAWFGASGALAFGDSPRPRRYAGLALVTVALALLPLAALALGRPWRQLEVPGVSPDPTALFTLGLLLVARRAPAPLFAVPLAWCAVSATTLWTLHAPDAWIPAAGAAVALAVALVRRPATGRTAR
jgi:hypothetical protein